MVFPHTIQEDKGKIKDDFFLCALVAPPRPNEPPSKNPKQREIIHFTTKTEKLETFTFPLYVPTLE
jgi:hypothetical protein